jgi:hypothetical protein
LNFSRKRDWRAERAEAGINLTGFIPAPFCAQ